MLSTLGFGGARQHPLQTQETCTAYNTMKTLEACFRWSLDPRFLDLMERLQYGGIIGTQRMPPSYVGHNAGCAHAAVS